MNPAPDRVSTTRILVVGLGAVGSATLYQLALRGIACHGIDAHYPRTLWVHLTARPGSRGWP